VFQRGDGSVSAQLRKEADSLLASDPPAAARRLAEFWAREPGAASAGFVVSRFEKLRGTQRLIPFRLAIERSFTVEPAIPLLRAEAFAAGIDLSVQVGNFNACAQAFLDPESALYRFEPDAVILAVETREAAPELWRDSAKLSAAESHAAVRRLTTQFRDWLDAFRRRSQASVIVHGLELPPWAARGVLDTQSEPGQLEAIRQVNRELGCLARDRRGVYVLDYDHLVARHGRLAWHDERKWLTMRMPIAAEHLIHLAREWMRFLHPLTGKIAKVLAVDLDNTLWGGIIGEDGLSGIKLGLEYPGAAYRGLQQAMLDLYHRGVLLAIASKNNPDDALEALREHPGMLLKPEHFAALRVNWNDKAQSLREIAAELNLGIDAVAFLDDNPVECRRVRDALPEVSVIELPPDPMEYARVLRECPLFERLALSEEDRKRGEYYAAERQRTELEQSMTTREDFFRSLAQQAEIAPVTEATLARVAQLTQKTNQFNLTTRRYSEQQIAAMTPEDGWRVLSIRVSDCFSDNGLVGVAITRDQGDVCEIDTFLLSCRVIGRTVETALLAFLAGRARSRGMRRLEGWFLPTKKNAPAREFYQQHGFQPVRQQEQGTLWALDLEKDTVNPPEWIQVTAREGA